MALRQQRSYPLDAIQREAQSLGGTLRAALERLVDQTAPLVAHADPAGRESILRSAVVDVRRTLRREFVGALRRLRRSAA